MEKCYAYCHGWFLDGNYCEVTCKKRERCQYYDEDFYRKHGNHLHEFEELFPQDPCGWFLPRQEEKKEEVADLFTMPEEDAVLNYE